MKKLLLTCALGLLMSTSVDAAPPKGECAYHPLQELIREANDAEEIKSLIAAGADFDIKPMCGGTIMQLAIRRGNAEVFVELLNDNLDRVNEVVSLEYFPIPDSPKTIPLWLFAGYYAPTEQIIDLMQQAQVDVTQTDEYGRNILWYIDRNPILRKTPLHDKLNRAMLQSLVGNSNDKVNVGLNKKSSGSLKIQEVSNEEVQEEQPQKGSLSLGNKQTKSANKEIVEPVK